MSDTKSSPDVFNTSITNTLISSFVSSSNNFTKQLSTVLLVSSIEEIKNILHDIFTYIRNNFKDILGWINPVWIAIKILEVLEVFKLTNLKTLFKKIDTTCY